MKPGWKAALVTKSLAAFPLSVLVSLASIVFLLVFSVGLPQLSVSLPCFFDGGQAPLQVEDAALGVRYFGHRGTQHVWVADGVLVVGTVPLHRPVPALGAEDGEGGAVSLRRR